MSDDAVDLTINRGTATSTVRGWFAPSFSTAAGEQPARVYLEHATQDDLRSGDALIVGGATFAVESVGWWPPDSLEAVLAGANLADACRIERLTSAQFSEETNIITRDWTTIWSGPCDVEIGQGSLIPQTLDLAADVVEVLRGIAKIPASATNVEADDRLTVTASTDGRMVGSTFTVAAVQMDTSPALRSLNLAEVR